MANAEGEKLLLVDGSFDNIVVIRLNRPEARNAIASAQLSRPADTLDDVAADDQQHAVVVTGTEKILAASGYTIEAAVANVHLGQAFVEKRPPTFSRQ